jgi:hypothetical protein
VPVPQEIAAPVVKETSSGITTSEAVDARM